VPTLPNVTIATEPPQLGTPAYNIGGPLDIPPKSFPRDHVLTFASPNSATNLPSQATFESAIYTHLPRPNTLDHFPHPISQPSETFAPPSI